MDDLLRCAFCGLGIDPDAAIEEGWTPDFFRDEANARSHHITARTGAEGGCPDRLGSMSQSTRGPTAQLDITAQST